MEKAAGGFSQRDASTSLSGWACGGRACPGPPVRPASRPALGGRWGREAGAVSPLSRRSRCSVAVGERQLKEAGQTVAVTSGPRGHGPDSSHRGGGASPRQAAQFLQQQIARTNGDFIEVPSSYSV